MAAGQLLEDERVLFEEKALVLTNLRVRYDERKSGKSQLMSITLDQVASCRLETRSQPILLLLAVLVAAMGLWLFRTYEGDSSLAIVMFILTLVLLAVYFIARRAFLVISSAGEPIAIEAKGMSRERLVGFIEALEQAKLTRGR